MARGSDRETESEGPRGLAEEGFYRSDTQKATRTTDVDRFTLAVEYAIK